MSAELVESDNPVTHPLGQGEYHAKDAERQPGLGSPIRIQVWLRHGLLRAGWAALCGALASGALVLSAEPLLQLALLIFLVDVVWGGLWSGLAATDWSTPLHQWQTWRRGRPIRFLPYTSPDGPAGRLAATWGQLRNWWVELGRPSLGPTLSALALLLPFAIVIAALLGVLPLLITLGAITLLQFIFVLTGGDTRPLPGPQALFEMTLPWLAGHALFSDPTLISTLLALAFGVSYAGGLRMGRSRPGLTRWNVGQIVAVGALVALRQPEAAAIAGLLLLVQLLVEPGLVDDETDEVKPSAAIRFVHSAQLWLLATMLVTAWGVGAANIGG